jgi:hypothetical protein
MAGLGAVRAAVLRASLVASADREQLRFGRAALFQNIELVSAGEDFKMDTEGKPVAVQVVNLLSPRSRVRVRVGVDPTHQRGCHERGRQRHDHHHGEESRRNNAQVQPDIEDDQFHQSARIY